MLSISFPCGVLAEGFENGDDNSSEAGNSFDKSNFKITQGRDRERFFRRVILESSIVSSEYNGADAHHYIQPAGYNSGILVDIIGKENLVLETGALYRELLTVVDRDFSNSSIRSSYLVLPATAKYYLDGQEGTSFYCKAGLMGATPTSSLQSNIWELAGFAGLGLKIHAFSDVDFLFEADYSRSFEAIFPDSDVYRSGFGIAVGIAINL